MEIKTDHPILPFKIIHSPVSVWKIIRMKVKV